MAEALDTPVARPAMDVTPVKRTKGTSFADARRREAIARLEKPRRRGGASVVMEALLMGCAVGSLAIAALVTLYVVLTATNLMQPFTLPRVEDGLLGNLFVSSLFFWLEVVAIVIGMRLIDAARSRYRANRDLFAMQVLLGKLINGVEDQRYDFAVKLDESLKEDGRYAINFGLLNIGINGEKNAFVEKVYTNFELDYTAGHIMTRIMRLLDYLSTDTFELATQAETLNRDNPAALVDCLNTMFDRTTTDGLRGLEAMLDRVRNERIRDRT